MGRPEFLDELGSACYADGMAKVQTPAQQERNTTPRGAGALKGRLQLKKSIDLTKPIASQAMKARKPASAAKH